MKFIKNIKKYFHTKKLELKKSLCIWKKHFDFSDWKKVLFAIIIIFLGFLLLYFFLRYFISMKLETINGLK